MGKMEELKQATQELAEKTLENNTAVQATALPWANPTTYAMAAQQHIPTALATVVTRGEASNKQMLIQRDLNSTDNMLYSLTEKELVAKANMALDLMGMQATDRPAGTTFIGAKKLRNGNILYQLNTQDVANWFKQANVKRAFMENFDGTSNIHNKLFYSGSKNCPNVCPFSRDQYGMKC